MRKRHGMLTKRGRHAASFVKRKKYDYTKKRVMRKRLADIVKIRAAAAAGSWVVGFFTRNHEGYLAFKAVKQQPTHEISLTDLMTFTIDQYHRWANRQAAHQWMHRNGIIAPLAVRNLASLLPPPAALTSGKPGRHAKGEELQQKFIAKKQTVARGA